MVYSEGAETPVGRAPATLEARVLVTVRVWVMTLRRVVPLGGP